MANGDRETGRLVVPVVLNTEPFQRTAKTKLREEANKAGAMTADQIIDGAKQRMNARRADAKAAFADKLIDKNELKLRTKQAMDAFDREILAGMKKIPAHTKGAQQEFTKLGLAMKNAGATGGKGMQAEMGKLSTWMRTGMAAGMIAGFAIVWAKVIGMARQAMQAVRTEVERGSKYNEARESLSTLAGSRGLSGGGALDAARRGSRGTVDDLTLIQRVNFALQAQLPVTERQLGTLSTAARRLSRTMGGDVTEAFQRLVNGIAKNEVQILEELGVIVRLQDVLRAWERQTGKNADSLTQLEKNGLFLNAVLKDLDRQVIALGEDSLSPRERLAQLSVTVKNLHDRVIAAALESPRIKQFFDSIGSGAEGAESRVDTLAMKVGALLDTFMDSDFGNFMRTAGGLVVKDAKYRARAIGKLAGVGSPEFQSNLQDREIIADTRRMRDAVAAERDLAVLQKAREAVQRKIVELKTQERDDDERIIELARTREGIRKRIEDVATGNTPEEVAARRAAAALKAEQDRIAAEGREKEAKAAAMAEEKRMRDLLKRFNDERLSEYELQISALDELAAAAKRLNDEEASVEIARQRAELEKQHALMERIAKGDIPKWLIRSASLRGKPVNMGPGAAAASPASAIVEIQSELKTQLATLKIAKEAGEITEKQWEKGVAAAVQAANKKLLALLKTFEILGKVAPEVVQAIADALGEVDDKAESTNDKITKATETFIALARGVLAVADAMGVLDTQQRMALEGAINLAEAIESIAKGNIVAGVVQGIGALVQLGKAAFGESPEEKARKQLIKDNNAQLELMRLEIAGWRADSIAARQQTERFIAAVRGGDSVSSAFSANGFTKAQLAAVGNEYNINVLDANGRINKKALEQLQEAMRLQAANGGLGTSASTPRLSVNITEMQANQLLDFTATAVDHLAAIRRAITGSDVVSPPVTMPAGISGGMGGVSLTIQSMEVAFAGSGPTTQEDARAVGSAIGGGMMDRIAQARQGAGIKGPHKIVVQKR